MKPSQSREDIWLWTVHIIFLIKSFYIKKKKCKIFGHSFGHSCQVLEANVLNTVNGMESHVSAFSCRDSLMFWGPKWYSGLFI